MLNGLLHIQTAVEPKKQSELCNRCQNASKDDIFLELTGTLANDKIVTWSLSEKHKT